MFLVEGIKLAEELLRSDWEVQAWILQASQRDKYERFISLCDSEKVFFAEDAEFSELSEQVHPEGIIGVVGFNPAHILWGLSESGRPHGPGLILDRVQDPGNLGTIIRTADWFGIHDLYCSTGTADWANPKALRAAMGSVFRVRIHILDHLEGLLALLGERVWVADLAGKPLQSVQLRADDYILLGNEAQGIDAALIDRFNVQRLTIEGKGGAESLNVGIAAAILCYHLSKA